MYVYRKLVPAEIGLFHDHLLRLTAEDRHCRFSGLVSDERIAEYCANIDWFRAIIIGCFIDGTLRGVAELRLDDPRLGWRAELAVTVELQRLGAGQIILMQTIARDGQALATARVRLGCVNPSTFRPVRIPEPVIARVGSRT